MKNIVLRNLKLFFRDKSSVFFSLLSVLIIIGLYVFFLGDMMISGMQNLTNPEFLINSWVMGGMLAVSAITTTMGAFGIMVEDRSAHILKDFYASPIKRSRLAGGYIVSSFLIGVIMSIVTLVLAEIFIVSKGGEFLSLLNLMKVFGLILLAVLSGSSMVFYLVSFFNSINAFATASTIIGTLIGFLTGIYIPIGNLPDTIQFIVKIFPPSHAAALIRQVMMEQPSAISFAHIPSVYVDNFNISMGVIYKFGEHTVTASESILFLAATTVLFYGLSIINVSRKMK